MRCSNLASRVLYAVAASSRTSLRVHAGDLVYCPIVMSVYFAYVLLLTRVSHHTRLRLLTLAQADQDRRDAPQPDAPPPPVPPHPPVPPATAPTRTDDDSSGSGSSSSAHWGTWGTWGT